MDVSQHGEIKEGTMTRTIEEQTAKIPSINWLALAGGSMVISFFTSIVLGRRPLGNFFGLWVPSLLLIGVYNKIVKVEAHLEKSMLH
jgi:hypothetical protein